MNHNELISLGVRWLMGQGCRVVIKELCGCGEEPDLIGFNLKYSIVLEAKTSASDFSADKRKIYRRYPDTGMGLKRYYLIPRGLKLNVNNGWGIVEQRSSRCYTIQQSKLFRRDYKAEQHLLISALRRLGKQGDETIAIKVFEHHNSNPITELHLDRSERSF